MLDTVTHDTLSEFIKGFGEDLDSLELLLFFGRHPNTRFNQTAIFRASGTRRFDAKKTLGHLISKGLITTCEENGTTLYTLTRDASQRSLVFDLLTIDQRQWRILAERILQSYDNV